jgi:hypothetical protein
MELWEDIQFANERHADMVQNVERRALRLSQVGPRTRGGGRLYRSAAHWLGRRRPGRRQSLPHPRATPARSS